MKAAIFDIVNGKGSLIEEENDLLPMRMFFGFTSRFIYQVNMVYFNGMRITLKTDGHLYKVLLNVASDIDYNHNIYAFIVDQSREWQTLELPLGLFLIEKESEDHGTKLFRDFMIRRVLKSVTFMIENEKKLDFEFAIKSIELVYKQDFEDLVYLYERPFFFRATKTDEIINEVNTGKDVLRIVEEQTTERKTSVNDLFTLKNKQQGKTFKIKDKIKGNKD